MYLFSEGAVHAGVKAATCIPMNDLLSGPLGTPVNLVIGALGGLIPTLILIVLVVLLVIGLVKTLASKDSSAHYKTILLVIGLPLVVILAVIVSRVVLTALNSSC